MLRVQSISNRFPHVDPRIAAEEKEQQLLEAHETIQVWIVGEHAQLKLIKFVI